MNVRNRHPTLLERAAALGLLLIASAVLQGCHPTRKNVLAIREQQATYLAIHAELTSRLDRLSTSAAVANDGLVASGGEPEVVKAYRTLRDDAIEAADSLGRRNAPRPWARSILQIGFAAQFNGWARLLELIDRENAAALDLAQMVGPGPGNPDAGSTPTETWREFRTKRDRIALWLERSFFPNDLDLIDAAITRSEALLEAAQAFAGIRNAALELLAEAGADSFLAGSPILADLVAVAARSQHNEEVASYNIAVTRYPDLLARVRAGTIKDSEAEREIGRMLTLPGLSQDIRGKLERLRESVRGR